MWGFSAFSRANQALVAPSSRINDLADVFADAMVAPCSNPVPALGYSEGSPLGSPRGSLAPRKRRSLARTTAKRVQLNVDVSADERRELHAYCKRHRVSMSTATRTALGLLFARERQ